MLTADFAISIAVASSPFEKAGAPQQCWLAGNTTLTWLRLSNFKTDSPVSGYRWLIMHPVKKATLRLGFVTLIASGWRLRKDWLDTGATRRRMSSPIGRRGSMPSPLDARRNISHWPREPKPRAASNTRLFLKPKRNTKRVSSGSPFSCASCTRARVRRSWKLTPLGQFSWQAPHSRHRDNSSPNLADRDSTSPLMAAFISLIFPLATADSVPNSRKTGHTVWHAPHLIQRITSRSMSVHKGSVSKT